MVEQNINQEEHINQRLDKIEKRLDALEERMKLLEIADKEILEIIVKL